MKKNQKLKSFHGKRIVRGSHAWDVLIKYVDEYLESLLVRGDDYDKHLNSASLIQEYMTQDVKFAMESKFADDDPQIQAAAAVFVSRTGFETRTADDLLTRLLQSTRANVRAAALNALTAHESPPPALITPVRECLADTNWYCRVIAANVLARVEPASTVQILSRALCQDDLPLLRAAIYDFHGADAKFDRDELDEMTRLMGEILRNAAATAFGRLSLKSDMVLPTLIRLLRGGDAEEQLHAIVALQEIGPPAAMAIPELTAILDNPKYSGQLRHGAANAIGRIVAGQEVGPDLLALLEQLRRSGDRLAVYYLARGMLAAPEPPRAAIEALARLSSHSDPLLRRQAAQTLATNNADVTEFIHLLVDCLREEVDDDTAIAICRCLIRVGEPAVAPLIELMREENLTSGRWAATALANPSLAGILAGYLPHETSGFAFGCILHNLNMMGRAAAPAVPVLIELLAGEYGEEQAIRRTIVDILGRIGPGARAAIPALVGLILRGDAEDRDRAEFSLMAIGSEAIPHMEAIIQDVDAQSRMRIEFLLHRLRGTSADPAPLEFTWVGDDALLALFVVVARILVECGPLGIPSIAKEITKRPSEWESRYTIPKTVQNISSRLTKLERLLSTHEGRTIRLRERDGSARRPGGLTPYGEQLLTRVVVYLEHLSKII